MPVYSRQLLSASNQGQPIVVQGTLANAGTLLHTGVNSNTAFDEVYLWITNVTNTAVQVTVQWGSFVVPAGVVANNANLAAFSGPTLLVPGLVIQNGLSVSAFCSVTNAVNVVGHINRIQ